MPAAIQLPRRTDPREVVIKDLFLPVLGDVPLHERQAVCGQIFFIGEHVAQDEVAPGDFGEGQPKASIISQPSYLISASVWNVSSH